MYNYMYVYNYALFYPKVLTEISKLCHYIYTSTCRFSWVAHQYCIIPVVWTCITLRVTINWLWLWQV